MIAIVFGEPGGVEAPAITRHPGLAVLRVATAEGAVCTWSQVARSNIADDLPPSCQSQC